MRAILINLVIISILFVFGLVTTASAQTPSVQWVNFFSSNSKLEGQPVPVGAVIEAFDPSSVLCGRSVVSTSGSYGFLACYVDDPNTDVDEGIIPGDTVRFTINGLPAGKFTVPTGIRSGDAFEVNLSAIGLTEPIPIPEPFTITLMGIGLGGIASYAWRRQAAARR